MVQTKTRCYTKQQSVVGKFVTGFSPWAFVFYTSLGIHGMLGTNTFFERSANLVLRNYTFETISVFLGIYHPESRSTSYLIELDKFLGAPVGISSSPASEIIAFITFAQKLV